MNEIDLILAFIGGIMIGGIIGLAIAALVRAND